MRLAELQESFVQSVLHEPEQRLLAAIKANGTEAAARLATYRTNVYSGLFEALKVTFPTVVGLVSEDFFRSVVHFYVKDHPPRSGFLDAYGATLPEFLQGFEPAASIPCLPDVARFDWLRHISETAIDDTPARAGDFDSKNALELATLRLRLRASASLLRSNYPIDAIGQLVQAPDSAEKLHIKKQPRAWVIFRGRNLACTFEAISLAEAAALAALESGQDLQQAASAALESDAAFDLSTFLITCFRREILKAPQ